ncbi:DUF1918 domain-containing protein [Mycetocola manganoxydans]|uniref:DUF1918 domain-containing protein n=1 Tax=Mycetocola manganoxydans TaxID=699879 RepID=A0A3L6ZZC2_9MICO|nr:DUF1918 domain-containing protein [Mycetocola manganoxydans]RLP73078.1 DUF1918 domain-containing protein [Mycetocola manganoxydans]GHD44188.1 DUF1918 domain-containing protein [Mycetocola manganoxydans]
MRTTAGERIVIRGQSVGAPDRHGQILEVRGDEGQPPYLVRFDDGHESLVYPGPDCVIEHSSTGG